MKVLFWEDFQGVAMPAVEIDLPPEAAERLRDKYIRFIEIPDQWPTSENGAGRTYYAEEMVCDGRSC